MNHPLQIRAALAGPCVLLALGIGGAGASTLAPAGVAGQVLFSNPPAGIQIDTFGTFPLSAPTGSLRFTAAAAPAPFLSADATMVPFFFGSASGTLVYQMEVLGPGGDVPVSVTVSAGGSGASQLLSGDTFAGFAVKAVWNFATLGGVPIVPEEGINTPSLTGSFSQNFGTTHDVMLTVGQVYTVTMTVNVGARGATAAAFVDPFFAFGAGVDPAYSFSFSSGIGNAPVPEPSSAVLLGAGLLVASGWARRRSVRTAVRGPGTR